MINFIAKRKLFERSLVTAFMSILIAFASSAHAQNRVVVIPLFGDDAASKWQGAWEVAAKYRVGDIVEDGGSSYISLTAHTADFSNMPPAAAQWDLVAASGANGMNGAQGPKGDPGDLSFGSSNTAAGSGALASNTSGSSNTASGQNALGSNTTGNRNTANGHAALFSNTTGFNNTAAGQNSLMSNTTGNNNTGMGEDSLKANTEGFDNTASGQAALLRNTTGSNNTASGKEALRNNTTGSNNTAVGRDALRNNTTGADNTSSGQNSLMTNTTGDFNTAYGAQALQSSNNAELNTAVGYRALSDKSSGSFNTAIGANALSSITSGENNIAIGVSAGSNYTSANNNISIGAPGRSIDVDTTRIGTLQKKTFITGIRGVTTEGNNAQMVVVDGLGQLGTISSSERLKEDIHEMAGASEQLLALRPVTFRYKKAYANGEKPIQYGLIAEEVAEVFPDLVVYSNEGQVETVKYHLLATLLLNELQKQAALNLSQSHELKKYAVFNQAQASELLKLKTQVEEVTKLTRLLSIKESGDSEMDSMTAMPEF